MLKNILKIVCSNSSFNYLSIKLEGKRLKNLNKSKPHFKNEILQYIEIT